MKKLLTTLSILLIATASYAQTYTVERVIDGDTIVVTTPEGKSETVHLIGIDAPESEPNDKAKRDAERLGKDLETINKMGQDATEFVKGLKLEGKEVKLKFDVQERDKYGRLLAYVYLNEIYLPDYAREDISKTPRYMYYEETDLYYMLNAFLVKYGYATPITIPPNVKYADLFKELYEEAREQKRGLWE